MLISRVADHCFWFGRYLERTEATARSLASTRDALMGREALPGAELEDRQSWLPVIIAAGEQAGFAATHPEVEQAARDGELVQNYMVWELRNPSSLRASIQAVRWNARTIRDHLSSEVWEQINGLHWWIDLDADDSAKRTFVEDRHAFYTRIAQTMALIAGLLRTTMLRDEPLDFIILGTMLERAGQTARILDVQHHALELNKPHVVVGTALWLALLRACGGYDTFMRRHRGRVSGHAVAAFLIQDPRFPRSIGFALDAAAGRLAAIRPIAQTDLPGLRAQQRLLELHAWLVACEPERLVDDQLHDVLTRVVDDVHSICADFAFEFLGQQ
jgi:uncharacterized alpha-E superfamily protein